MTPLVVKLLCPVPPYCTAKSVANVSTPIFTVLVALPRLIVLAPAPATFNVPVVRLLNKLTEPVVTSLFRVTAPAVVLAIFKLLPVNAPPTTAAVVAVVLLPMLIVPLLPKLTVPVTLCHALTIPLVTSVV